MTHYFERKITICCDECGRQKIDTELEAHQFRQILRKEGWTFSLDSDKITINDICPECSGN